jgi:glycyl-tRNA synthetase alpha chain
MLDGMEITQFTYFQQCGGVDLDPISVELTYGLERLCAFLQDVDSVYDIVWARSAKTGEEVTYRDVRHTEEYQFSVYNFETADVEKTWEHLRLSEAECKGLLERFQQEAKTQGGNVNSVPILAAFDLCLKCSHLFNLLDARGAISVTERVGVIGRIRNLAVGVAKAYAEQQSGAKESANVAVKS